MRGVTKCLKSIIKSSKWDLPKYTKITAKIRVHRNDILNSFFSSKLMNHISIFSPNQQHTINNHYIFHQSLFHLNYAFSTRIFQKRDLTYYQQKTVTETPAPQTDFCRFTWHSFSTSIFFQECFKSDRYLEKLISFLLLFVDSDVASFEVANSENLPPRDRRNSRDAVVALSMLNLS